MYNVVKRIDKLRKERGWSIYRLATETGLSQQTIHAWYDPKRSTIPTVATIENLCDAFSISLSEFFAEGNLVEVTPQMEGLHKKWKALSGEEQALMEMLFKKIKK